MNNKQNEFADMNYSYNSFMNQIKIPSNQKFSTFIHTQNDINYVTDIVDLSKPTIGHIRKISQSTIFTKNDYCTDLSIMSIYN